MPTTTVIAISANGLASQIKTRCPGLNLSSGGIGFVISLPFDNLQEEKKAT
jgi:hypothetical protein